MTNKTKLIFVIVCAAVAGLFVLMSAYFADTAGQVPSTLAGVPGLEDAPAFLVPGVLVVVGLYLAFRWRRAW